MRMKQAKEARSIGRSKWLDNRIFANMIGVLFVKSYERAENVYLAMCSRGFDGKIRTIDNCFLEKRDIYFLIIIVSVLFFIRFIV